ncbi:MAG: carboxypeptidase-like regulatory domain-containing protein, partial [Acidobacteriota bacterium]
MPRWVVGMVGVVLALLAAAPSMAQVASGQLQIAGTRLVVTPEAQTVPFDTPTVVSTLLEGYDPLLGSLPSDVRVVGDFSGPEIDGILTLETVPNEPFRIPRLRLEGEYWLDDIRVMQGDELLAYAEPRSATVNVTQVLLTSVSVRALDLDEIRGSGIVIDEDNFQAFNFTFGFGTLGGRQLSYDVPVLYHLYGADGVGAVTIADVYRKEGSGGFDSRFKPPGLVPFQLRLSQTEEPEVKREGCGLAFGECYDKLPAAPMVGAVIFPTDISLLHQFFSVILQVQNGAPEGDVLTVRDLNTRVMLPAGLRQAETDPPTPLGVPVPIRVPGPDGEIGTGDDLTFLVAQASGAAEVLVEGVKEGTHIVDFAINGILEGMPGGDRPIEGKARGAVVVRNPNLGLTISHPETVRVDEVYPMRLTLTNIGTQPVNLLEVAFPASGLSGAEFVGPSEQTIASLMPGDADTLTFWLRSQRTGRVIASTIKAGSQVSPRFELTTGVGSGGVPLSPDSILLPSHVDLLPTELVRWANSLLGLGQSLAVAPSHQRPAHLPQLSREAIDERIYRLGQTARHMLMGEDSFAATALLGLEWNGARDADWDWDQLRRSTDKGGLFDVEIGAAFDTEAQATSMASMFERYAEVVDFLQPIEAALVDGAGLELLVEGRISGKAVDGDPRDPGAVRDLPFAAFHPLTDAEMVTIAAPEPDGHRVVVRAPNGGTGDVRVLVSPDDGVARIVSWTGLSFPAGTVAEVELDPAATTWTMFIDDHGDGLVDRQIDGQVATVTARPFQVLGARQNEEIDPSAHIVDVLFSRDIDLGSLNPRSSDRFELLTELNESNGGWSFRGANGQLLPADEDVLAAYRDTRIVRVVFSNPVSPLLPQQMAVRDLSSADGVPLGEQIVDIVTTITTPGQIVEGTVIGPDGEPVPFADVVLKEADICTTCLIQCQRHVVAKVQADAQGRYRFPYVRTDTCSAARFALTAEDPIYAYSAHIENRARVAGAVREIDIVMTGRGRISGRVTYEDGSIPETLDVFVINNVFGEGRRAWVGDDGAFNVEEVLVGQIQVTALDDLGNVTFQTLELPVAGSHVEYDLVIVRQPGAENGEVRGRVLEADGVTPAEAAYVALVLDGKPLSVVRSAADGTFDFGTVPVGVAEIQVYAEGVGNRTGAQIFFDVLADQVHDHDLVLRTHAGAVRGYVRRIHTDGTTSVIAGAVVYAEGQPGHTLTDSNGYYELDPVLDGTLGIRAADLTANEIEGTQVTVVAGTTAEADIYFEDPPPPGAILGQVLDYDGTPVSNARVTIAGSGKNPTFWFGEWSTDSDGRFVIPDRGVGLHPIHAMKGNDGGWQMAEVRFPGDTAQVTIQFKKASIRLRTVVRNGQGLTGVSSLVRYRVTKVRDGTIGLEYDWNTDYTDADGYIQFDDVLLGDYQLYAYNAFHGEHNIDTALVVPDVMVEHEIVFTESGALRGTVYDHDGVTPLAGATVELQHPFFSDYDVISDTDGSYRFELVPKGSFIITATRDDGAVWRTAKINGYMANDGQEIDDLDLVMPAQGSVNGVVETANGDAVPGAVVTLYEGTWPRRKLIRNADEQGHFSFQNVFVGPFTVSAKAPTLGGLGGRTEADLLSEGDEVSVVVTLADTGEIHGVVISPVDGQPVSGAEVSLRGSQFVEAVVSDTEGRFEFELLPLRGYEIRAFDPSTGRYGKANASVDYNDHIAEAEVVLQARGEVDGHLVDSDGVTEVPGVPIRLVPTTPFQDPVTYSSTNVDGFYEFFGVPEGTFEVYARELEGRREARGNGAIVSEDERVTVDLQFEASGALVGSVLNPPGMEPGLFANANVRAQQGGFLYGASLDNPYRIEGLLYRDLYKLIASELGGSHQAVATGYFPTEGGDHVVDLQMVAIGDVEVEVYDGSGNPVIGASVVL